VFKFRTRIVVGVMGLCLWAFFPTALRAGLITAHFDNVSPGVGNVDFRLGGTNPANTTAGMMRWTALPYAGPGQADAGFYHAYPLNTQFTTFCVELTQVASGNITYSVVGPTQVPSPGYNPVNPIDGMGVVKANDIRELYARFYSPSLLATEAAAFQVAVWEIVHEGQSRPYNVIDATIGGVAQNFYLDNDPSGVRARAQFMLTDITNNSYSWSENASLAGKHLVGLSSITGQDQIGLTTAPAPAGIVLAGIGGVTLLAWLRRRRTA
jgi:hypothetical protein